jgi:hypothetical protein
LQDLPLGKEFHLGDEERQELSEVATIATLEVVPANAADGWRLAITVEDEIGPRMLSAEEGERQIDLNSFFGIFIRSGRGNASVSADVTGPAARRRLDHFLSAVESNLHPMSSRLSGEGEAQRPMWRVAPNPERRASEWWDYARASPSAPRAVLALLAGALPPDELRVTEVEAAEIAAWAGSLPGWQSSDPDLPAALAIEPVHPKSR